MAIIFTSTSQARTLINAIANQEELKVAVKLTVDNIPCWYEISPREVDENHRDFGRSFQILINTTNGNDFQLPCSLKQNRLYLPQKNSRYVSRDHITKFEFKIFGAYEDLIQVSGLELAECDDEFAELHEDSDDE